jgi:ketosteroid isomerase-like protein
MRAALLIVVVAACTPAPVAPTAPQPPGLAAVSWLAGSWHTGSGDGRGSPPGGSAAAWQRGSIDTHWQEVAGAIYGVTLAGSHFEVDVIDDNDDDGQPAPLSLFTITAHQDPFVYAVVSAAPGDAQWKAGGGATRHFTPASRGERVVIPAAPELSVADRQFAADTKTRGADGWASWFAPDGEQWTGGARISGTAAIAAHILPTLQHGTLDWTPLADGKEGDLGYTLGTWKFTAPDGAAQGSYCTIWQHQPDGSWKVAMDLGRPAAAAP